MASSSGAENSGVDAVRVARPQDEVATGLGDLNISDPASSNPFVKPDEPSFDDIYATEAGAPPGYSEQWQPMQPSRIVNAAPRRAETGSPGTSPSLTNASTASSSSRLENFSSTSVDKGKGKATQAGADIFAWAVKNDPFRDSDSDDGQTPGAAAATKSKGKGKAIDDEWALIQSQFGDDSDDDIPPPQDRECMVCAVAQPPLSFPARAPTKQCQHKADVCYTCLTMYIEAEVASKGAGSIGTIKCPASECQATMEFEDVAKAADKGVFERYETLLLRQELGKEGDFVWCKNPKCGHGQLHAEGDKNPIVICHSCKAKSCFQHDCLWHEGITCTQYDRELNGEPEPAPPAAESGPIYIPPDQPAMPGSWDNPGNGFGGGSWNIPQDLHGARDLPAPPTSSTRLQKAALSSSSTPGFLKNVLRPFSGPSRKSTSDSSRAPAGGSGFSNAPGPSSGSGRDGLTDEDLAIFAQFSEDPPALPPRPVGGGGNFNAGGGWNAPPAQYQNQAPAGWAPQQVPGWFRQQPSSPSHQQAPRWNQPSQQWVDPNATFDSDKALAQRLADEEQQYERDRQMAFEMEREMRADEERRVRREEDRMREAERRRMEQERARAQQERIRIEQERAREWRRQEEAREEARRLQHVESERQRLAEASRSAETSMEQKRRQKAEIEASERWMSSITRECPKCKKPIEKNGGCDHMKCSRCGKDFSWASARPSRPK